MKPVSFEYEAPASVAEALGLLERHGEEARVIAGGQSLMPMLALRLARPSLLVDLNRIPELAGIANDGKEGLRIGAMTRQADILRSPAVAAAAPLLVEALRNVGHPPTRARGTIGGSLSHADPAAELPVALVALDAGIVVRDMKGARIVPAGEFFLGAFETALNPGEIVTEIRVPEQAGGTAFLEISPRKGDFAIVSVAVRIDLDGNDGDCRSCALVLGGVTERPLPCEIGVAELAGHALDEAAIENAVAALPLEDFTMDSRVASVGYRRRVAPVLVRRALAAALSKCREARAS